MLILFSYHESGCHGFSELLWKRAAPATFIKEEKERLICCGFRI